MREPRTILLTWNPRKWEWENLDEMISEVTNTGSCVDEWSVGRTKDIAPGDRFYLLHIGSEPRGIMASGWVMSHPESKPHWDGTERSALYVDIEFDRLFKPHGLPLSLSRLQELAPLQHWTPQSSGTYVKDEYLTVLERALDSMGTSSPLPETSSQFVEGTAFIVHMTRYERDPRNREACLAHYGMKCVVCGFDFKARYGLLGEGFIHVHHLNPLGSIKRAHRPDPLKDMRPVCPNCHAMLHRKKVALSIDELKALIS